MLSLSSTDWREKSTVATTVGAAGDGAGAGGGSAMNGTGAGAGAGAVAATVTGGAVWPGGTHPGGGSKALLGLAGRAGAVTNVVGAGAGGGVGAGVAVAAIGGAT